MKAIIIGAGISGLAAAVYARQSGWETLILEKGTGPGGLSTSWSRKGYTFEGGIHWLIGAIESIPLHHVWVETGALQEKWARKMRKGLETTQCMFLGLGLQTSLAQWPRSMQIVLSKPFQAAGITFDTLIVNNYSRETEYAPEGCSVLTCLLHGPSYGFWKQAKEKGYYAQEKQVVVERFIGALSEVIPEIRDKVAVTDMATPLTYKRYCDTHEGSYMTNWPARKALFHAPIRYRRGLYFTGQRTLYSGGLPPAAQSGRLVAQTLCRDFGMVFQGKEDGPV